MSWQTDVKQDFTITTGDGRVYIVFWNKASKVLGWHHETFSFIRVRGQLIKKEEALARQFPMDFYFQGENHLETSREFEDSLNDKNPVTINHPIYRNIVAQIVSITFDDSDLNATKITCVAIETINYVGRISSDPFLEIQSKEAILFIAAPAEIAGVGPIKTEYKNEIKNNLTSIKNKGLKIVTLDDEVKQYTNAFNQAINFVNVLTETPIQAMAAVTTFITMPARFTALVSDRLNFLVSQFKSFLQVLKSGGGLKSPVQKKLFEIQCATCISSMCIAAVTPVGNEYTTSASALKVARVIDDNYTEFLTALDDAEISQGGVNTYYTYSPDIMFILADCVNITISNIILIALNGKQERFINVDEDTNVFKLTHKYYGMSDDDSTIDYFCTTNNLTYHQMIQIKKGTKIVYYV